MGESCTGSCRKQFITLRTYARMLDENANMKPVLYYSEQVSMVTWKSWAKIRGGGLTHRSHLNVPGDPTKP